MMKVPHWLRGGSTHFLLESSVQYLRIYQFIARLCLGHGSDTMLGCVFF